MHADPALDNCQPATDRMASIRAAALDAMAEIGRSLEIGGRSTIQARQRIKAVAERAAEPLNGKSVSITALASYLPEISSEYPRRAIYAVVFLVHLARALRKIRNDKKENLNPVVVIELVAGTRVEGVARCIDPDDGLCRKHVYFARQRTREQGIKCLCNNLRSVVDKVQLRRGEKLALALELEPGPLFLLNDLPSMRMMAKELDRQELSSIVGFNLDIAHFSLARVTPDELMKDNELLDRITHVHISDHGQGHFGDVIIGQSGLGRGGTVEGNFEPFHGWIKVIDQLSRRPEDPERPAFSGHVSLEMEASKREAVELSLERLNTLLSGV
jgi:sugar phosphate isomerase/epimerase